MKLIKFSGLFLLLLIAGISLQAQSKYWVFFNGKGEVDFNPYEYFDSKVIEKRINAGIPLVQDTDLPVNESYCEVIESYGETGYRSRWLNAVAADLDEKQLKKILSLDFVQGIRKMEMTARIAETDSEIDSAKLSHLHQQLDVLGGKLFYENGFTGEGVRIAVFDGGFPKVDELEIFSHLFENNRIISTYDFTEDSEYVYDYNSHGTSVLACIAGILDGERFGLAPDAEFLLARTEVTPEIFAEEEYWAAAMEWADRNGADIISSSLGYTYHRYFPRQMDGKSVFVTRMANLAARKGMLVISSAGNSGDSEWEVISAPADADSVLSVGGISSFEGMHIGFSSFGPTYDGRLKPNVVAFGNVITTGVNDLKTAYGTSFSTPLVTGFAACVMQMHPGWEKMKVFKEIEKSGHLYPYFDYAHGYGVPQASYFFACEKNNIPTFRFEKNPGDLVIKLTTGKNQELAAKCENLETSYFGGEHFYFYYHIASKTTGKIRKYRVIRMTDADSYSIDLDEIRENEYVMAHYKGYTEKFNF